MKYTDLESACEELRAMGQQFICPKDEFFGAFADEIERLQGRNQDLERAIHRIDATLRVPAAEYVPAISDAFTIIDSVVKVKKP